MIIPLTNNEIRTDDTYRYYYMKTLIIKYYTHRVYANIVWQKHFNKVTQEDILRYKKPWHAKTLVTHTSISTFYTYYAISSPQNIRYSL